MITKELTNDQRSRLEQIARDEFNIKQREISNAKNKELTSWVKAETTKMAKSALVKRYEAISKEMCSISKKINDAGFSITRTSGSGTANLVMTQNSYSYDENGRKPNANRYYEKSQACRVNQDSFTRALNKVLSVIWSMEKPFSECIKLIETEVKKIK